MILLVTQTDSKHADLVAHEIESLGKSYFRLNVDGFLQHYALRWRSYEDGELHERATGRVLNLGEVNAVWWYDFPEPSMRGLGIDRQFVDWARYETRNGLLWVLASLDAWYMSRPEAIDAASLKTLQIRAATDVGLKVPPTVISNDPSYVRSFVRDQAPTAFKTIAPLSRERGIKTKAILTTLVTESDIEKEPISVKLNLFQKFIRKRYDVRVIIIDDEVFSVRIDSQRSARTTVDWRRYDIANTPHTRIDLPPDISRRCVRLTKMLGLNYGAIDLVLSDDGQFFFLEINPVGLWLWLEGLTGVPVSKTIAKTLVWNSAKA